MPDSRRPELLILLGLMLVTTLLFWLTDVDIQTAAWFYHADNPGEHWPEKQYWLWRVLFVSASPLILTAVVLTLLTVLLSFLKPILKPYRRPALYILLVIAIGPGLIVNVLFKNHWGRPRPVHIQEFSGEHQYIPPLQIGHSPDKSFVCGHCSVAYSGFALYFLAKRRKWLYLGLTLGFALMMGYSRMAAGGHFLSDVLWSGYLVFLTAYLLYYAWYKPGKSS